MRQTPTIAKAEADLRPLIDDHEFKTGDYIFMNNYGEPYFATEKQWMEQDPRDVGFTSPDYPEDCFTSNRDWFTELEVVEED